MSRIAGYIGPETPLKSVLMQPEHSVFRQARTTVIDGQNPLNADGFGLGWFQQQTPHRYTRSIPVWHDRNLPDLAASITTHSLCCCVAGHEDSHKRRGHQPMISADMLFLHDGFVENFDYTLKPACLEYISPEIAAGLEGHCVSEYLFAMLLQRLNDPDHVGIELALQEILSTLEVSLHRITSELNIIIATDDKLIAARQATNTEPAPMFYAIDPDSFTGAGLVSSEPLSASQNWRILEPRHMIAIELNGNFRITRL